MVYEGPKGDIENCLQHSVDIVKSRVWGTEAKPLKAQEDSEKVPRAIEEVKEIGVIAVGGCDVKVCEVDFIGPNIKLPYDHNAFKVLSLEGIASYDRDGLPIDNMGYPIGVIYDRDGKILGCEGLGMPQRVSPKKQKGPALTADDLELLRPPEEWENLANHPINIFSPNSKKPIFQLPTGKVPVRLSDRRILDRQLTDKFGVPIFRVWPDIVEDFPNRESEDKLRFMNPTALRHAALAGKSLRFCVTLGDLVRDKKSGNVIGGRSIRVYNPKMLSEDGY